MIINNEDNRDKLAWQIVTTMDNKDLVRAQADQLAKQFENDEELFQEEWANYYGEINEVNT